MFSKDVSVGNMEDEVEETENVGGEKEERIGRRGLRQREATRITLR